ncbi:MAG TPA: hypothetical protein VHV10_20120 [Ktedonobacteraceae bacterium]|jgi:hypothetical protein|nr:hypothetical protein [Ktedonobacteraceae bacterium]
MPDEITATIQCENCHRLAMNETAISDGSKIKIRSDQCSHCYITGSLVVKISVSQQESHLEHENDLSPEEIAEECAIIHPNLTHEEYEISRKGTT